MRKIYNYLAVVFAAMAMTSCFDDPGRDVFFTGNEVEFDAGNLPNGLNATFVRATLTQTDVVEIQVNRVSTDASAPISVTVGVDPSSTAVQGVQVDFTGTTVTIPAGEFVVTFPVTILTGNIDPSESPVLALVMESATGAELSDNYSELDLNIQVICPSDLAGTWVFGNGNTVTVEEIGTGNYSIDNLNAMGGYFGASNIIRGLFTDNCNVTELYGTTDFGVQWRGTGVYDPDTETITWETVEDLTFGGGFQRTEVVMTRQ